MATLRLAGNRAPLGKFKVVKPPSFKDDAERQRYQKGSLALGARVMHEQGWGIGYGVGLSARDALEDDLIWVLPRGKPLNTIVTADLIGINLAGEVVRPSKDGREVDPEWVPLHLAVYNAREDVCGVATGHTPYARTFAAKGETVKMLWQDSCPFYNRLPVCPFLVAANADKDPKAVGEVLGKEGSGLVLQNRGLLSCAGTIEGAVGGYIRLEGLCGNQMLCEAAIKGRGGELHVIGEEEILFTQKNTGGEYASWFMSTPYFARQVQRHGDQLVI